MRLVDLDAQVTYVLDGKYTIKPLKDFVDVIRCKNCVHSYIKHDTNYWFCGLTQTIIQPNGFCSSGRSK